MSGLTQRFQLFKTVADLHSQGRVKLSNEEQRLIERESMDLIRKSMLNRTAEKAPPGFESVLQQLSKAPDADSAYGIIVEYLKSQGDLGGAPEPKPGLPGMDKGPGMGMDKGPGPGPGLDMDKGPGMGMGMDKGPEPKPGLGKGPEMGGGPGKPGLDMGKSPDHVPEGLGGEPGIMKGKPSEGPMHEKKESPMEEGMEHGKPAPKPEGGPAPKPESTPGEKPESFGGGEKSEKSEGGEDKDDDKGGEKPEKKDDKGEDKGEKKPEKKDDKGEAPKKEREALRRRAQEQAEQSRIKNLQKEKKDFGKEITSDEMGLEATEGMPMSNPMPQEQTNVRAKKVRVHTTPSGTIVASHIDFGPIFHAVPSEAIRGNAEELRRLANRVYGKIVYEGFMKAAKFCNAKIIRSAGIDDGVELNHVETVEPKTKGITDGAENVNREKPEGELDSLTKDPEVVTREKPSIEQPDVLAGRRKALARAALLKMKRRQGGDILDQAENVTKDHKPSKPTFNTGDDAETNATEQHGAPEGRVIDGGDNVIRNAQTHFQKLYATRMAKKVAAEKEAFIRRFTRAMRLSATRMLLNHEEHPFKAAAVDVLADNSGSIEFSDGQRYTGMDVAAAVELTELIASEGHKAFLDALLTKAADLMGKDDRYLADAESDLAKLAPVSVSAGLAGSKTSSFRNRSVSKRRAAVEGNFEVTHGTPATGPEISKTADLRGALGGGTLLGRRLERLGRG